MRTVPLRWKKSSRSAQEADCVELAFDGYARDSKNRRGPVLKVGQVGVVGLVMAAKSGLLDRG